MPYVMNDDFELVFVPEAGAATAPRSSQVAPEVVPLAVVANFDQLKEAKSAYATAGRTMEIPTATVVGLSTFKNPDFVEQFHTEGLDGATIHAEIGKRFAQYNVHIGLLSKFLDLRRYKINMVLDDSGSMRRTTDSLKAQACSYMQNYFRTIGANPDHKMTRFEEVENLLHIMIEFLAFIPTKLISITFMNRSDRIYLTHDNQTPDKFIEFAHNQIRNAFKRAPTDTDLTPTMKVMQDAFALNNGTESDPTMHYLFTDGDPSDCTTDVLGNFLKTRRNPNLNPLTLVSCTDDDNVVAWMKKIEETGPFIAEIDDYSDEYAEVMHDQGLAFPYTRGLWLMSLFMAAINPHDLDAMDDSRPFSKFTMDNIMGRVLTKEEYLKYWNNQPTHDLYQSNFRRFAEEPKSTLEMFGELSASEAARNENFVDSKSKKTSSGLAASFSKLRF